jgi:hypothetical protein
MAARMSDSHSGVYVAFEKDLHEDQTKRIVAAIQCLRGVLKVEPHVADFNGWLAEERARTEIHRKLLGVLFDKT